MEWVAKLGAWAGLGFLVGIGAVTWLGDGLKTSGAVLIIALCITAFLVIGGIVQFVIGGGSDEK